MRDRARGPTPGRVPPWPSRPSAGSARSSWAFRSYWPETPRAGAGCAQGSGCHVIAACEAPFSCSSAWPFSFTTGCMSPIRPVHRPWARTSAGQISQHRRLLDVEENLHCTLERLHDAVALRMGLTLRVLGTERIDVLIVMDVSSLPLPVRRDGHERARPGPGPNSMRRLCDGAASGTGFPLPGSRVPGDVGDRQLRLPRSARFAGVRLRSRFRLGPGLGPGQDRPGAESARLRTADRPRGHR